MENENVLLEAAFPRTVNWESLVKAWESSGLTRQAFCEHHQVDYQQFVYQRSKLNPKRKHKPPSSAWLAVKQTPPQSSIAAASVALSSGFVLRSTQGNQLSIPLDADAPTLKILLDFMRGN